MHYSRGSEWRLWDLHIHTPASHSYQSMSFRRADVARKNNDIKKIIENINKSDRAVFAINDYWTFDGYWAIKEQSGIGDTPKLNKTLLPGIELRIESASAHRLNIHVLFSEETTKQMLEDFKNALVLRTVNRTLSEEAFEELGRKLPASSANKHGFNGAYADDPEQLFLLGCTVGEVTKESFEKALATVPYNKRLIMIPYDCYGGMQEIDWKSQPLEDLYFMQMAEIVETRNPKNVELFSGIVTEENRTFATSFFQTIGRPKPCISGSDGHSIEDFNTWRKETAHRKTWIKADTTFEGLRQAVFEFQSRIFISNALPLEPIMQIRNVTLSFPNSAELSRGGRTDAFCFSGNQRIPFSPYLTCIIGGRGSGKSTLLNLLNEKTNPGKTEFFKQNRLLPTGTAVDSSVTIDGITEQGVVEFLQQNEIEQFATDHKRLTEAIFSRLRKLDDQNILQQHGIKLNEAISQTKEQKDRLRNYHLLTEKLSRSKKELVTHQDIVKSFQDTEYKRISDELTKLNRELHGIKTSRDRLDSFVAGLKSLASESLPKHFQPINAYDEQLSGLIHSMNDHVSNIPNQPDISALCTHEHSLNSRAETLRTELNEFLKSRGLSAENLSDVGRAAEMIAELEEKITYLKKHTQSLSDELQLFKPQRDTALQYANAVNLLLKPINENLKGLSAEVKPIELSFNFDFTAFKQAITQSVIKAISNSDGKSPRPDYIENKLKDIDFTCLVSKVQTIDKIPDDQTIHSKKLREFFAQDINFETLKLEVEHRLLEVQKHGQISVLYDGKPVENTSFGQRCTAVIVVLLLLGNTPIVIDEPEAHLDSALIAKYLVELLKNRKSHRQIIFATHNANFVINGDADLIHHLSMSDDKHTKIVSTTIENLANRELLLALEGGEKAFQKRERRYGIN